jgi:hypothetical protein
MIKSLVNHERKDFDKNDKILKMRQLLTFPDELQPARQPFL